MKKILKSIKNIIVGLFLFIYLAFIILISTLLLNRNDYGITQFGDKALILVDEFMSNEKYPKGSLVIVQEQKLSNLKYGDEIFVYKTNKKDRSVQVIVANVGKINLDATSPYVVLENDGTAWGEEFVAGTAYEVYADIGMFLSFIESKWIFFCLLIVPCFFILLYEIHLVIITIKFGDIEDEENDEIEEEKYKEELESKNEEIEELMKQIKELKKENKKPAKKETEKKETEKKETKKSE